MTQDEIIQMAREAGLELWPDDEKEILGPDGYCLITNELERFANLVAAHERKACAKWCEQLGALNTATPQNIAAAIRARGEK